MTEERKRYLASISKEERAIRDYLWVLKESIKLDKVYLSQEPNNLAVKDGLRFTKYLFATLKKQLPAPVQCMSNKFIVKTFCAVCKGKICDEENYCPSCGQKLR